MFQTLRANIFVEGLLRRFSKFQHLVVSTPQVALAKGESQRLGLEVLSAVAKGNGKNMEERRDCDCDLHDFYKYIVASQYIFKMHNWPPPSAILWVESSETNAVVLCACCRDESVW